ncbi:MAG: hypothetical protein F6J98_06725 [Moorea sp. SIO4G2]|uniref:hypothetical protein n=1 Tax=Moorena bouillonii TaxID=207920 RepID=UPI001300FA50|nr:hypothetical protein [Moorena bouillonii]NEO60133.1 hypothetical protein [Moorena sp. SIO4G2]
MSQRRSTIVYSVSDTYEVHSILWTPLPTPYSLLPTPYSLLPILVSSKVQR